MTQQEINNFIDSALAQDKEQNPGKVSVVALRPGMGKSHYISERMKDAAIKRQGLIVVTDSCDRLNELHENADEAIDNLPADNLPDDEEEIAKTIEKYKNAILVLTMKNFIRDKNKIDYKPVIAMSTQRFFRLMPDEINQIIDNHIQKITDILIDETPYIMEPVVIKHKDLCDIEVCLDDALTNLIDPEVKARIIETFSRIKAVFLQSFNETEQDNPAESGSKYQAYYPDMSEDVATMTQFAIDYREDIEAYSKDVYKKILDVISMMDDGWNVISNKIDSPFRRKRYGKQAMVINSYQEWFTKINARISVLDGTGDVDPYYRDYYFSVIDCTEVSPQIPQLTINIYNLNTSSTSLEDAEYRRKVVSFAKFLKPEAVFTHQDNEKYFSKKYVTEHFGNIKGSNKFRDIRHIVQVGLNRLPQGVYDHCCYSQILRNESNTPIPAVTKDINRVIGGTDDKKRLIVVPDKKEYPERSPKSDGIVYSLYGTKNFKDNINFMCDSLLADTIQNIFRAKIRNYDNQDSVVYDIIFQYKKDDYYTDLYRLVTALKDYFQKFGVTINEIDKPIDWFMQKIKERKVKKESVSQKIVKWLEEQIANNPGREVTKQVMCEEIGIKTYQFDHTFSKDPKTGKVRNEELKARLDSMRIKRGVYKIPAE